MFITPLLRLTRVRSVPLAAQLGVGGLPDLAHAAFAKEGGDVVVPERGSGREDHGVRDDRCIVAQTLAGFRVPPTPGALPFSIAVKEESSKSSPQPAEREDTQDCPGRDC